MSRAIAWLRFPLMLLVIHLHLSHAFTDTAAGAAADRAIWGFAKGAAVQLFFFISGYLAFRRGVPADTAGWLAFWRHRVLPLLCAYLLWCGLYWLTSPEGIRDGHGAVDIFWCGDARDAAADITGRAFHTHFPPLPAYQLWYVRDLIVMFMLSPIWVWIIRRLGGWVPLLALGVYFCYFGVDAPGFHPLALCFFPIGLWCSLHSHDPLQAINDRARWLIPLAIILIAGRTAFLNGVDTHEVYLYPKARTLVLVTDVACCILMLWVAAHASRHRSARAVIALGGSSFFVYLTHVHPVIGQISDHVAQLMLRIFDIPAIQASDISDITANIICIACLPALWMLLAAKTPRLLSLLTGGRPARNTEAPGVKTASAEG